MEIAFAFRVDPSDDAERPGAYAAFPYDRDLVRRFRERFPRARWRGAEQRWFVRGTTAVQRLEAWMAQELETLDRHADAKGRDAYIFDPLESPYLTVADDLKVRTPYSRTVVEALRQIPWAHWDPEERIWRVPFRSYEELKARWPEIEEAAQRNEPEARKRRREERKAAVPEETSRIQAERRRRRYPVPGDDLPPLGFPVGDPPMGRRGLRGDRERPHRRSGSWRGLPADRDGHVPLRVGAMADAGTAGDLPDPARPQRRRSGSQVQPGLVVAEPGRIAGESAQAARDRAGAALAASGTQGLCRSMRIDRSRHKKSGHEARIFGWLIV